MARKKICILVLVVLACIGCIVASPSWAQASTAWDSAINPTDKLLLTYGMTSTSSGVSVDYAVDWTDLVLDNTLDNNWTDQSKISSYRAALTTALSSGYWAVTQVTSSENGQKTIVINYSNNSTEHLRFLNRGSQNQFLLTNALRYCVRVSYNNQTLSIKPDGSGSMATCAISSADAYAYGYFQPFASTYPVSYPAGYEGELVPQAPPPATYVAMGDSFRVMKVYYLSRWELTRLTTHAIEA